jgi:alpha-beta hydrolase superfamily lysophospholipase
MDYTARSWKVGGDLVGYSWPAARPRAELLLQHGYAEYAERFVSEHSRLIPLGISAEIIKFTKGEVRT